MVQEPHLSRIHLISDPSFYSNYLVDAVLNTHGIIIDSIGIAGCFAVDTSKIQTLHRELAGCRELTPDQKAAVATAYPDFGAVGENIVRWKGFTAQATCANPRAAQLSHTLQCEQSMAFLRRIEEDLEQPLVLSFTDTIFRGKWLSQRITILNAHPGIIPFALGVGALEQIAARQDVVWFRKAAGCTVHVATQEIDLGPVIATRKLADPFGFSNIAELRAQNFLNMFSLIAEAAQSTRSGPGVRSKALPVTDQKSHQVFLRRERTSQIKEAAEHGYQAMRRSNARGLT